MCTKGFWRQNPIFFKGCKTKFMFQKLPEQSWYVPSVNERTSCNHKQNQPQKQQILKNRGIFTINLKKTRTKPQSEAGMGKTFFIDSNIWVLSGTCYHQTHQWIYNEELPITFLVSKRALKLYIWNLEREKLGNPKKHLYSMAAGKFEFALALHLPLKWCSILPLKSEHFINVQDKN